MLIKADAYPGHHLQKKQRKQPGLKPQTLTN
jgi:hypothetical protein